MPDNIVKGENTNDTMVLGYNDSTGAVDQGGNTITENADTILGGGGDDTIESAGGNDIVYGDAGEGLAQDGSGTLEVIVTSSPKLYDGKLLAEVTDASGNVVVHELSGSYKSAVGTTFTLPLNEGDSVRVGIQVGSSYRWSDDTGAVRTQNQTDNSVDLRFEDGGDGSFDDVMISTSISGNTVLDLPNSEALEPGEYGSLLTNGGFDGNLNGWTVLNPTNGNVPSYSGGSVDGVRINGGNETAGGDGIEQGFVAVSGEDYVATVDLKTNGSSGSTHTALIEILDENGTVIASQLETISTGQSETFTVEFTAISADNTIRITNPTSTNSVGVDLIIEDVDVVGLKPAFALTGGGDDTISSGAGDDTVYGEGGNDTIDGGTGNDTIFGGTGDDVVLLTDAFGTDSIDGNDDVGNADHDTLDMSGITADGVNVALSSDETGTATSGSNTASFTNIENLVLTGQDDTFDGNQVTTDVTVDGGAGNDVFMETSGSNTFDGGAGADTFNVGIGDSSLIGGAGIDTLSGVSANDTLNITLTGDGEGSYSDNDGDSGTFTEIESFELTGGNDVLNASGDTSGVTVDGGDGNDSLVGGSGDDEIAGGAGADTLDGGAGSDSLFGGDGDDDLVVGKTDTAYGGTGDDVFTIDPSTGDAGDITIVGGEGVEDLSDPTNGGAGDTLDLTALYASGAILPGSLNPTGPESGTVTMVDGTTITYSEIESVLVCFAKGTQIKTRSGLKAIEDLMIDDEIVTKDNGYQKLRWIGSRKVAAKGNFAAVTIKAGAMGNDADLMVSQQHRMLVQGWKAELLFGEPEVLVAAKHLVNGDSIFIAEGGEVEYFHMLFDTHEIVYANGAPSESFHPGELGMGSLAEESREEILTIFPELRENLSSYGPSARSTLKANEALVFAKDPDFLR